MITLGILWPFIEKLCTGEYLLAENYRPEFIVSAICLHKDLDIEFVFKIN